MNNLKLIDFKAHKDLESIFFENKNFLLYGDNGAGKSSIYEAIKVVFFKDRLSKLIQVMPTPAEREAQKQDFWSKYNNKNTGNDFQLEINDEDYNTFNSENYQLFMLSLDELQINKGIHLDILLKKFYFSFDNIDDFCSTHSDDIENSINTVLQSFRENIQIEIDIEDDYAIKIKDTTRNLESKVEIKKYFNEAKINLVLLLLVFESIKKVQDISKKRILVLDDFITSLDVANRTFLIRYIFDNFSEFQILIFTHNVYFYNLIMYLVNDIYKTSNQWKLANLYEINGEHKLSIKKSLGKVSKITERYKNGIKVNTINCSECNNKIEDIYQNVDINEIGNQIRQKFEVLLYEFSKLLMIGGVEDSKKIIERIENSKNIYFYNKKTASDLLDELYEVLSLENPQNLQNSLKTKIERYRQNGFSDIQDVVRNLKLYQKVTLHPMSHGTIGQSSFTTNEIEESLDLLEKFENYIKDLIDSDVDGA